jgi:hypothetical protein
MSLSDGINFWVNVLTVVGGALGALAALVTWMVRQSLVTHTGLATSLAPHIELVGKHETRLTQLEADVEHLPPSSDWSDVRERLVRVEAGQSTIEAQLNGIKNLMERIERPLNVLVDAKLRAEK